MSDMRRPPRALLLDDDKYALEFLRMLLSDRYPRLEIDTRLEPDPSGEYDFYFLDDDFEGIRLAGKLARQIRVSHPDAVILAFSASLDSDTLKELLGAGCNGVCDKKVPTDMPEMLEALDRCMRRLETKVERPPKDERPVLLKTFRDLFREWNQRLGSLE